MIRTIAFDGDDTLWHNESIFTVTQERFRALLATSAPIAEIDRRLFETEVRNLKLFGYGVKGFTLSMIETAIDLSGGRIGAGDIQAIVDFGKAMLRHPVELLDGVPDTIDALDGRYGLMLITKGDLFDQESKIARSGLADRFDRIEIVAEKDERTYRRILERVGTAPGEFVMVGNSMRSDILPVLDIGGVAVHVPYHVTWAHEAVSPPPEAPPGFFALDRIGDLPDLLARLS